MNEDNRADWLGAVLSLLYEFNWAMTETEIFQRSKGSGDIKELRSLLGELKRSELVVDAVPGNWRLTKKGKEMVKTSLGQG
jgi:hypothetical protein